MRKSMGKWGLKLPLLSAVAASNVTGAGQTGNVVNKPVSGDLEFLSPISVGGQVMMMDFDTGSSDL